METNKKVWIYDVEQFQNFHCATFLNRDNLEERKQFVIYSDRNEIVDYYNFLTNEVSGLIGFNCVNYDYPLIHYLMALMKGFKLINKPPDADNINRLLYEESQRIIQAEYSRIPEKDVTIPQLDLYLIHHFDNKAKATSLKAVEIAINHENVQDLPFDPDHFVLFDEVEEILKYNGNDVDATYKFYLLTKDMIDMRKKLGNKYHLSLLNANDPKIGQEIFITQIAKKKNISYRYLKELRTYRHKIHLADCILPEIKFNSSEFNKLKEKLNQTIIETTYDAFDEQVIYKGFKYVYGTGGIHGCIEPGRYDADDKRIIKDIDVKSFYPNLAIVNGFYPKHLGIEFVQVYKEIFDQRVQAQKEGDKATNSGLKLSLNGVYGKSNDKFSPFYDPLYTMQITMNGQLSITMLAESIVDKLKNIVMLQINTDGLTIMIDKEDEEKLYEIAKEWESVTKLILEYKNYKTMVIRDVNNYFAIDDHDEPKYKGCFEIIPMQNGAIAYNKDWSMRVVPKALDAYYRFGTPVEDFIINHDNIYDFCIGFRAREGWEIHASTIVEGRRVRKRQQKTIRYYISKNGCTLTKINDGKEIQLNSGFSSTLFNKYVQKPIEEYNIDYGFYIAEANKIKYAVYDGQLKMF